MDENSVSCLSSLCFYLLAVQSLRSSIPAPPANFKLREDHLSGSSIKGNHFYSFLYLFNFFFGLGVGAVVVPY